MVNDLVIDTWKDIYLDRPPINKEVLATNDNGNAFGFKALSDRELDNRIEIHGLTVWSFPPAREE